MLVNFQELVMGHPVLLGILTVVVILAAHYQKGLTYREYRFIHIGKCWLFYFLESLPKTYTLPKWLGGYTIPLNPRKNGRPLINTIGGDSYVMTVEEGPRSVYSTLAEEFSPHLIATAKKSVDGSWSHSQLVQYHDDQRQTEAVLFANPDGSTSVYGHLETSVTDPEGHVSDAQEPGDPLGAIQNVLEG